MSSSSESSSDEDMSDVSPDQEAAAPASVAAATAKPSSSENGMSNQITSSSASPKAKIYNAALDKKWLENFSLLKPCIMEDGSMDYSSLDEGGQKRMANFVKDQRKCFKKREKGQEGPMTDERFTLLSRTKFDFKPSETAKGKLTPSNDGQ